MDFYVTFIIWLQALIPLVVLAIAFYMLIFKRLEKQRSEQSFLSELNFGMRVRIKGNRRAGTITAIMKSSVIIAFDDGTKSEVLKFRLYKE